VVDVADFVAALQAEAYPNAQVTYEAGNLLPFPADLDDSGLRASWVEVCHIRHSATPSTRPVSASNRCYRNPKSTWRSLREIERGLGGSSGFKQIL
jgi:hypothetical protein